MINEIFWSQIMPLPQNCQHLTCFSSSFDSAIIFSSSKILRVKFWLSCKNFIIGIILNQIMTQSQTSHHLKISKLDPDLAAKSFSSKLFQIKLWLKSTLPIIESFSVNLRLSCEDFIIKNILNQNLIKLQNLLHKNYSKPKFDLASESSSSNLNSVNLWLSREIVSI